MDFSLPEELRMLKSNLRHYVDTQMIPFERETLVEDELPNGAQNSSRAPATSEYG